MWHRGIVAISEMQGRVGRDAPTLRGILAQWILCAYVAHIDRISKFDTITTDYLKKPARLPDLINQGLRSKTAGERNAHLETGIDPGMCFDECRVHDDSVAQPPD